MNKDINEKVQLEITQHITNIRFKFIRGLLQDKEFEFSINKETLLEERIEIEVIRLCSRFRKYIESITKIEYKDDLLPIERNHSHNYIVVRDHKEWERLKPLREYLYKEYKQNNCNLSYSYLFMQECYSIYNENNDVKQIRSKGIYINDNKWIFPKSIFAKDIQITSDKNNIVYDFTSCIFAGYFWVHKNRLDNIYKIPLESGFVYSIFLKIAKFSNITFISKVNFSYSFFQDEVTFCNSIFKQQTKFVNTKFNSKVYFDNAVFSNNQKTNQIVSFLEARFQKDASFNKATFKCKSSFQYTKFYETISFYETSFEKEVDFYHARLSKGVFLGTIFNDLANFERATFKYRSYFTQYKEKNLLTIFKGKAIFTSTTFNDIADFRYTKFQDKLDISMASFTYLWLGNTTINSFDASNTLIEKAIIMDKNNIISASNFDSYRLLKDQSIKQNNRILAWEFHKLEMNTRLYKNDKHKVMQLIKNPKLLWENPILSFNALTNDHGTRAYRSILSIIIFVFLGTYIEYSIKYCNTPLSFYTNIFSHFMAIIKSYNPFSITKSFENLPLLQLLIHFFFTTILVALIWQLLQAFRRYSKMP